MKEDIRVLTHKLNHLLLVLEARSYLSKREKKPTAFVAVRNATNEHATKLAELEHKGISTSDVKQDRA